MKNIKGILITILILLIVAVVLMFENRKSTINDDIGAFAISDTASVTRFFMADRGGLEVLFVKKSPGNWTLNDSLKARKEGVAMLLNTMRRLSIVSPVSKSSYNGVIKRLASSSVKVEIYQMKPRIDLFGIIRLFPHETLTRTYYVGYTTPDNLGTFMLLEGADVPFVVSLPGFRGAVSSRFSPDVNDWRDHTVFARHPGQIRSIEVVFPDQPGESYLIEKQGSDQLKLIRKRDNETLDSFDTVRVVEFINAYRNIRFEAVLDAAGQDYQDSVIATTPVHIITLTDTSGFRNQVKTYRRPNTAQQIDLEGELLPWDSNRFYALLPENQELVLIQYFVFDPITRPLSYLLGKD